MLERVARRTAGHGQAYDISLIRPFLVAAFNWALVQRDARRRGAACPVMVATGGARLREPDAMAAFQKAKIER
jgi:hypothetical protein